MTKALRWGIVGTGKIARTFASDLAYITEGTVQAVGSRSLESAKQFAREFEVPDAHGSYEELVSNPNVDAVYVATPHPMHRSNALLVLNAGKPVLVEKAFTMNAGEAREVVGLAREKNLFLMEAMWTRFLPHVVKIRELVASGALGKIVAFEADHGKWFPEDPTSRLFAPELGGSALLDLGVYPISFASMLLGKPTSMKCVVEPAFTGVDGYCSMLFTYEQGVQSILTCTSSARTATRACISGTEARIEIDGDFYAPGGFSLISKKGEVERFEFPTQGRGLHHQAIEVAQRIWNGEIESPWMPLDETVEIMATMDEVLSNL